MSRSSNDSSWSRRRSLFALTSSTPTTSADNARPRVKTKGNSYRKSPSLQTNLDHPDVPHDDLTTTPVRSESPRVHRPSLSLRGSIRNQSTTMFGSLKSSIRRSSIDDTTADLVGEPLAATPSSATSFGNGDGAVDGMTSSHAVLLHGEVQTSAGMFRKKKEYLVLSETHIVRYKSQLRAAETYKSIPRISGRPQGVRHDSRPSASSQSDFQTLSDSSGDKLGRVALRKVVAVQRIDDGKPHFALEVSYLDEESAQASALTMQLPTPEERDAWLRGIRSAANECRLRDPSYVSEINIENVARAIEREHDYDPENCAIYKVVQRQSASKASRSSADDLSKIASTVCFLAIGVHKVHIVQVVKSASRGSSPSMGPSSTQVSYGILTLTSLRVSDADDAFELTFRQPLQPARVVYLASSASYEIAARLHFAENFLRPECGQRLFKFIAPPEVDNMLAPPVVPKEELSCFDRTLAAYCVAYGINPASVRYAVDNECEDAPTFQLLPPGDDRRPEYGPIALLAIMRSLRNNESFGTVSFAGVNLDSLNGLHDKHGREHVCMRTKRGTPLGLTSDELGRCCLLVQEVRALAATSKRLRRMDFSSCVTVNIAAPLDPVEEDGAAMRDIGCGVVEALVPLCRHQTTNVDWIGLNGVHLSDTDLDYLVSAAVDKSCHFRALELNRCGLNDRSMGLILDALRAQDNTLESIEIAGNTARLEPSIFDSQLSMFGFIRKLDLSYVSRTSGDEPFLTAETLLIWRLQELRLSGTTLNAASIDAVATYLGHPQSRTLHELSFDNAYLSGNDVATLLHSLSHEGEVSRDLHLDISQNRLTNGLEEVTKAIADGLAPSHLSMRAIEYREESAFRKMLAAITANKSIVSLDMSQTALPGDASEETCRALREMLAENETLLKLDISGEDSRLALSRFGAGINDALIGLKQNKSLEVLRVEHQKLGLRGASTLAEVLKENSAMRELHCDNNEIPLHGLTDLINSLIENTTLIYLPTMNDGRDVAFKSAENTMKGINDYEPPVSPRSPTRLPASFTSVTGMRNTVRRSAARAVSYTPSFPALPSYSRSNSSPEKRLSSHPLSLTQTRSRQSSNGAVSSPPNFTIQDIQTTHRLLTEQWDRQCYRLAQYLERNWCLLNNIPVDMAVEDEAFERPESVGSLTKMLEQVTKDTTPRVEKPDYFNPSSDSAEEPPPVPLNASTVGLTADEKHHMSFRQFLVETPGRPEMRVEPVDEKEEKRKTYLVVNTSTTDYAEEPTTPTQGAFTT